MPSVTTEPTLLRTDVPAQGAGFYVIVLSPRTTVSFPVSAGQSLVIGRSSQADVQLEDPLLSRKHLRVDVEASGAAVTVMDLGSANGTRFNGARVAKDTPTPLRPGEAIEIGNSIVIVQRVESTAELQRVWSHQYFTQHLTDACRDAEGFGKAVSVLRLRAAPELPWKRLVPLLLEACGANLLANYGANEYEVIVTDGPDAATSLRDRLLLRLTEVGATAEFGLAHYPRDGHSPDALFSRANPSRQPASPRGHDVEAPLTCSAAMAEVLALASRVAVSDVTVLLLGETGVGKEVMAQLIHQRSGRAGKLVSLNCAGLTEALFESELFGHEKGAFTGAAAKLGLFETAEGGTVLLDEVGELPLALQAKLLRVLQDKQLRRVGGLKQIPVDVRFIAATNRDLEAEVAAGKFRQDLFFRINGVTLSIPPLRERRDETLPLAARFVAEAAASRAIVPPKLSKETCAALLEYWWPGNIRELKNVMERAMILCLGDEIRLGDLPADKMRGAPRNTKAPQDTVVPLTPRQDDLQGLSPAQISERARIITALQDCAGNQTAAAERLGMPRRTFVAKLATLRIPRPRTRPRRR